ncbi:hypothetical protein [Kushneria aurantia]|uniref:Uncharacterized protein n=1 Tax=Kushneria aurantia TaxID=504092 RepID=A0ABV6G603_9GAMM|nr:hypothetical protein [Kushneria aurantia]
MDFLQAYNRLQDNQSTSEAEAQRFLDSLDEETQDKVIAAIYLGRYHFDHTKIRSDLDVSRGATDHIPRKDYARIIHEKSGNIELYLNKLEECARNSDFNIDSI